MKKIIFWMMAALLLVGCSSSTLDQELETARAELDALETEIARRDETIAAMETQVLDLTATMTSLQSENEALQAAVETQGEGPGDYDLPAASLLCEQQIENVRYQNPKSTIAILEGWFAVQPQVAELQGTYSTQFWTDVKSRIHTLRYLNAEDNLSKTSTFLIFFEEAGWQEGILWMTEQCWLDSPHAQQSP